LIPAVWQIGSSVSENKDVPQHDMVDYCCGEIGQDRKHKDWQGEAGTAHSATAFASENVIGHLAACRVA
jgi:hypothetical protein